MQTLTTKLYYKDGTATKGVTCTSDRKGEKLFGFGVFGDDQ